jgi:sulfoxide reductase heme-binding subunit YedZ
VTTWIILRAAGIGAYMMLFGSVAWGLIATTSLFGKKVPRATATSVHQFLSMAALVLLGVHIGGLLLDRFLPFHPLDVLVPLHSTFRPVAVALGIAAMYGMVVVLVSSWTKKHVGNAWWRRLHVLAAPAFTMSMLHGIFAGTDTVHPWMLWIYASTGVTVLFLLVLRGLTIGIRPQRAQLPDGVRARRPAAPAPSSRDRTAGRMAVS